MHDDGLTIAKLSGAVQFLTTGPGRAWPLDRKIVELHAITGDPKLLGHVLGRVTANAEQDARILGGDIGQSPFAGCAPLLRAAGADEAAAEASAAECRERLARFRGGHQT